MRISYLLALATLATPWISPAQAEEAPAWTVTKNIAFVSDYYARGVSQSWHKPAVQGGFDVAHSSGFYAGMWGSSISPQTYVDSTTEIDVYAGYNGSVPWVENLGWTTGVIGYIYPGGNWNKCPSCTLADGVTRVTSNQRFDTYEANIGLTYGWLSAKGSITLSDWYGANKTTGFDEGSKGTTYLEVNANYPLPWYDLTLVAHAGILNVTSRVTPGAYGVFDAGRGIPDYQDYKIGLSKVFNGGPANGLNLGVYYVGASDKGYWSGQGFGGSSFNGGTGSKDLTDNRFIISASGTF